MNGLRHYSCNVCNLICNSAEQLRSHESGKSHLSKCARVSPEMSIKMPLCYQPLQISPASESDSDDFQFCPMCCNQYSQADFVTHACERDLLDSTSLLPAPIVLVDTSVSSPTSMKKESAYKRSDFYCGLCDVSLGSMSNYDAHVRGKKHVDNKNKLLIRKAQTEGINDCGLESLSCSLSPIKLVEGSDSPLIGSSLLEQPKITLSSARTPSDTNTPSNMYCRVCDVHLNSSSQMVAHVSGRKHQSKLTKSNGSVDVSEANGFTNPFAQSTPMSRAPVFKPIVSAPLPPNSVMCLVCNVPVGLTEIAQHEKGRAHIYKAAIDGCAKFCKESLFENHSPKREFDTVLPSVVSQLPPIPQKLKDDLSVIAEKIEDVVLLVSSEYLASVSAVALAIAMGIVSRNRLEFEHTFSVWICPQNSTVPFRLSEARELVKNFSQNKPLLANIQKDTFSLDETKLELTKHHVAFSTPGSLINLMTAHSNIHRVISALVLTDMERCVDNDPTHSLLTRFCALPTPERPRIICITSGRVQKWPQLSTFLVLR